MRKRMPVQEALVHLNATATIITIISLLFPPGVLAASMAKPGCPEKCGNMTIPYPFGMGKGCYLDKQFEITCNDSSHPPSYLVYEAVHVLQISLDYLQVAVGVSSTCYGNESGQTYSTATTLSQKFSYSHTWNHLVVIGCDIFAYIVEEDDTNYISGCSSLCPDKIGIYASSSCSGFGCCRTTFPRDLTSFGISIDSVNASTSSASVEPCSFAFIADKNFSEFDKFDIPYNFNQTSEGVPAVLNWTIGNVSCHEAMRGEGRVCGQNSDCIDSSQGSGYKCHCSPGYRGNPYLPNGCQDIDECKDSNNSLCNGTLCINLPGSYICTCPSGHHPGTNEDRFVCVPRSDNSPVLVIVFLGVGTSLGFLMLLSTGFGLYRGLGRLKKRKLKQKFFKENGGLLLQKQLSSSEGSINKTKVYVAEELQKATDNFNASRILGKGGLGTVYKGMLSDGSIVAIKKSNIIDEKQVSQFINEVFILSQINHRHIVKLLGCCLETEVPLLVYQYVHNGTLSDHLHDNGHMRSISWENRLRIATEIAGALAYLHSCASPAIFHRDIKPSNILLDEYFRAIISDFGLSKSISINKTHFTTLVQGTFGYLDPEYFRSGQFTSKSDVYSYGVVLVELLTGEKAVSLNKSEEGLVSYFISAMKQNCLSETLSKIVVDEGQEEDILLVAKLAKKCLKVNREKRPTMAEVATNLQQLRRALEQQPLQQDCQDNYSLSDRSYSYKSDDDAVTEEIVED